MTYFVIIAVVGFLVHVILVTINLLVFSFSNANAYSGYLDDEFMQKPETQSTQQALNFFDTRLLSLSLAIFGVIGAVIANYNDPFLKSLIVGLVGGLIVQFGGIAISKTYYWSIKFRQRH